MHSTDKVTLTHFLDDLYITIWFLYVQTYKIKVLCLHRKYIWSARTWLTRWLMSLLMCMQYKALWLLFLSLLHFLWKGLCNVLLLCNCTKAVPVSSVVHYKGSELFDHCTKQDRIKATISPHNLDNNVSLGEVMSTLGPCFHHSVWVFHENHVVAYFTYLFYFFITVVELCHDHKARLRMRASIWAVKQASHLQENKLFNKANRNTLQSYFIFQI